MKKVLPFFIIFFAWLLSIIVIFFTTLSWLNYHDYFSANSLFFGLDYVPSTVYIIFILPAAVIFGFHGRKKLTALIICFFIIYFLDYGDFSFKTSVDNIKTYEETDTMRIKVSVINLRYYSYGLDGIIAAIKEINADIYLLSENEISPEKLRRLKNGIAPFELYMGKQEGTAIISRFPVVEFKEIELPSRQASLWRSNIVEEQDKNPHRSFVHAVVNINNQLVNFISIRFIAGRAKNRSLLEVIKWARYLLHVQLKEVAFFREYLTQLQGPIVFGGDLNAAPTSKTIREISKIATDAYFTDHVWGGFTFHTLAPLVRLDYIFSQNNIVPVHSEILLRYISDHFPVYAEFLLPLKR